MIRIDILASRSPSVGEAVADKTLVLARAALTEAPAERRLRAG